MDKVRAARLLGLLGAIFLPAVAVAELLDLEVFTEGTPISSSAMNDNFEKLNEKLSALELALQDARPVYANPETGDQYSLDASYCDSSLPTSGDLNGYTGAKALCETECGSPTAHMCTVQEMIRYHETGGLVTAHGWVSHGMDHPDGWTNPNADCTGWTDEVGLGHTWIDGYPWRSGCAEMLPVHCCD
jgi:hypothetical protein